MSISPPTGKSRCSSFRAIRPLSLLVAALLALGNAAFAGRAWARLKPIKHAYACGCCAGSR